MPRDGDLRALRQMNRRRVVDELIRQGPLTQAQLARSTGLSPATVSSIVRGLSEAGSVEMADTGPPGRRGRIVQLASDLGIVVGIDIGHRHLRVALGALDYSILGEAACPLPPDHDLEEDLDRAERLIEPLLRERRLTRDHVVHTAVGLPAPLDVDSGRLVTSPHLPTWDSHVGDAIAARLGDDVEIDNDANLGALGELVWGAARGVENAIYIKISTSIGAGLIVNGRLFRGERGTAGEIGHMTVEPDGRACFCGNRGCLLTVVGAQALLEQVGHIHGPTLTVEQLVELAEQGDRPTTRVLEDAGRYVGVVIGMLCNVLNPARVVVGGTLAATGGPILDAVRVGARRHALPLTMEQVDIVQATLGVNAEVRGAIALAIRSAAPDRLFGPVATAR